MLVKFILFAIALHSSAFALTHKENLTMLTLAQLRAGELAGSTRLDLCGGLTEFPREIFELENSLEILNLSGNKLRTLPDDLGRLTKLRILFCSENEFTHLPEVLGECSQLRMMGFKANKIVDVPPKSLPASLQWLILTDNCIFELPATIGHCKGLQKLMLSGNRLQRLPGEMANCTSLELIRLAANDFAKLPNWLFSLPKLAWLAFAGNPCSTHPRSFSQLLEVPWHDLTLKQKLGEGASGEIHHALWGKQAVAVKLFKNSMTSDGLPRCEMEACLAAELHEHLIPVLGRLINHPEKRDGLMMSLIDPAYVVLASPPSFASCTRDIYADSLRFTPDVTLSLLKGVASAAEHLHRRNISHGDIYAHNVLWREDGACYLGDFGAATLYDSAEKELALALQGIEVRAFGCLMEELLERTDWPKEFQTIKEILQKLRDECLLLEVKNRPSFVEVVSELQKRPSLGETNHLF